MVTPGVPPGELNDRPVGPARALENVPWGRYCINLSLTDLFLLLLSFCYLLIPAVFLVDSHYLAYW